MRIYRSTQSEIEYPLYCQDNKDGNMMDFTMVTSADAEHRKGFVVVANGDQMEELMGRIQVESTRGKAFQVDDVKGFMKRNSIPDIEVSYLPA